LVLSRRRRKKERLNRVETSSIKLLKSWRKDLEAAVAAAAAATQAGGERSLDDTEAWLNGVEVEEEEEEEDSQDSSPTTATATTATATTTTTTTTTTDLNSIAGVGAGSPPLPPTPDEYRSWLDYADESRAQAEAYLSPSSAAAAAAEEEEEDVSGAMAERKARSTMTLLLGDPNAYAGGPALVPGTQRPVESVLDVSVASGNSSNVNVVQAPSPFPSAESPSAESPSVEGGSSIHGSLRTELVLSNLARRVVNNFAELNVGGGASGGRGGGSEFVKFDSRYVSEDRSRAAELFRSKTLTARKLMRPSMPEQTKPSPGKGGAGDGNGNEKQLPKLYDMSWPVIANR